MIANVIKALKKIQNLELYLMTSENVFDWIDNKSQITGYNIIKFKKIE